MTLEQRVEALELAIANMAVQQSSAEDINEIARKITVEIIVNAQRPGGVLNAAQERAALKIKKTDGITAVRLGKIL